MIPFWLGVSCFLLFFSGREGRVYSGRKKPPTLTAQRLRSGPHHCYSGIGGGCCPGWTVSPGTGLCLQPLCSFGCGSGFCIAPNVCSCRDGQQGVTCADGFAGEHERDLEDKGEWGLPLACVSALCDQNCKLANGAPVCSCFHGYSLGKDGKSCYDVDECSRPQASNLCQQQCKNSIGSYRCLCFYGYQMSPNGRSCIPNKHPNTIADIDECSTHRSACQQRCRNLHGSYRCLCGAGFTLQSNGHSCADINECRRPGPSHLCQHFCHNTHGSFFCSCRAGFLSGPDKVSCVDVDECLRNATLCSLGSCVNTLGSYRCSCPTGFLPSDSGCSEVLLEMQTTALPQDTQTSHEDWAPLMATTPAPASFGRPGLRASQASWTDSMLAQEHFTTMSTLTPRSTLTDPDPLPPPQHLRTSHSPLAQKASVMSHMPLKEEAVIQPGTHHIYSSAPTPTVPHTHALSSPCWHNTELRLTGSHWTEPGCVDCSCQEGHVSCERRICSPNCSHPVLHPQSCCPLCNGCLYEGLSRAEGELFPITPDNCTICICLAGNVTCIPPSCPPVTCNEAFMSECCLRCPDGCEFQGQLYPHGATFSRDESGCASCLCQNGAVECSFLPCPNLECPREDWVLEVEQCCFKCQEAPERTGCPFDDNGVEIPIGQIWSPGDPCAICICQADSSIVCKKTDCVETCPHPITVPGQCCPDCSAGCSYGRRTIRNNESFPSTSDPCLTCICLMGTVACSPIECALRCTYPFHDEGECCPVCRDCTYEGRKVLNGQTFSLESEPCTQCTCQAGEVQCEEASCSASCSHPYVFPGECCSACEECVFEGHVLENGASYILKADPCVVCHCSGGNVQCEQKEGPCPPCEQKTQACLSEALDLFDSKQFQRSHTGTRSQIPNVPLKLQNVANPSQSSRLFLLQRMVSRRNTITTGSLPTHPTSSGAVLLKNAHLDVPASYPETVQTSNRAHRISREDTVVTLTTGPVFAMSSTTAPVFRLPYSQASDPPVPHTETSFPSPPPEGSLSVHPVVFLPSEFSTSSLSPAGHPGQFLPHRGIEGPSLPPAGLPTSFLIPKIVPTISLSAVGVSGLSLPSSSITDSSAGVSGFFLPPTGVPISFLTRTSVSISSLQPASIPISSLLPVGTTTPSLLPLNAPGTTLALARLSGQFLHAAGVTDLTSLPLGQVKHKEMKSDEDLASGHTSGCSLNGLSFTDGAIFIADVDVCLQCECLKGKVYCRPEIYIHTGLCCQGCSNPPVQPCTREINQVQSQWGEGRDFCKCEKLALYCQSCSNTQGCSRENSQSSESDQTTKEHIHWIPLTFEGGLNLMDENPSS
ncbi:von Willebrand factor C and EGF domain-containing protein isoform X3 [Ascaphus truei]|uniref:von Willebrand factor C and EGF domain-containing protein isoform X3 n=1 Tax=Ascaphus truei TaxID=8439 RepID=UPI003F59E433